MTLRLDLFCTRVLLMMMIDDVVVDWLPVLVCDVYFSVWIAANNVSDEGHSLQNVRWKS